MKKETLSSLLHDRIFCIPDYQRGYAWTKKQWSDFTQDIDALVEEDVKNHYTGTVVVFQPSDKPIENYGSTDKLYVVDVVDGQQRLTTSTLYLSIVIRELINRGLTDFQQKIPTFLYSGAKCKLKLNNDTNDFFFDLISKGVTNTTPSTTHQIRLKEAYDFLTEHILNQCKEKGSSNEYLLNLFDAIVRKLNFTFYTIEEECEIGMTFELMNSRGKDLSILELLKNYLMYWVSRNEVLDNERETLTRLINKSWKEVYTNIALSKGSEDQCLKIAWILYCSHTPKYWNGYEGFKENWVIPMRDFSKKTKQETKHFIITLVNGLAEISNHYAIITNPQRDKLSKDEFIWLSKIRHAGNIANFLPLIVSARIQFAKKAITENDYIKVLQSLELYAYRVYLWQQKRSNAGMSNLYRWAQEVHNSVHSISNFPQWIYRLVNYYSPEDKFVEAVHEVDDWYSSRSLLKYTLFEYELWLLEEEGKGKAAKLSWEDLSDSTIEHILPQTIDPKSYWKKVWNQNDVKTYLHDIGNLVLTESNSHYRNFDFARKSGKVGEGYCYANSDVRQERKIASYPDWTVESCIERRNEIAAFIEKTWRLEELSSEIEVEVEEDE